ncbi:hypothetical protein [Streptomyces olivaceus]|uniref:hypothetical protein n=1 Tax=Streptomyces olivaceus TaxID=47716 RepID=UPI0036801640
MADTTTNIPDALPLSPRVKGLKKEYDTAVGNLAKYKAENARYAPRKSVNSLWQTEYTYPAIQEAKRELREQEIAAVEAGKPLPDRQAVLRPIEKYVEEYRRTVPALEALVTKARKAYEEGVRSELTQMGLREAKKAAQSLDAYRTAYRAMETARAALEMHAGLFSWVVSGGDIDTAPRAGHSQGDNLEAWELTKDGMLTWEASLALEFQSEAVGISSLVKTPGLVEENPNPPVAEELNLNHKPKQFLAKDSGHQASWF